MEHKQLQRANILGVGISPTSPQDAIERVSLILQQHQRSYICVCATHIVNECQKDPALRTIVNSSFLSVPDGMPLVWFCHLLGHSATRRVYGPDLMLHLCEFSAAQGYRIFLLGGRPAQPELLKQVLVKRFPGLEICGMYPTPHRPLLESERQVVIDLINKSTADIVIVGMGTPHQERWMADNQTALNASLLIGVGAAFDLHTGIYRQAPHWVQQIGMEWFIRLVQEPGRLWRRYLLGNSLFIYLSLCQLLGIKKFVLQLPPSSIDSSLSLSDSDPEQ